MKTETADGFNQVSGGYLGKKYDVIVDNYNPKNILGVCDNFGKTMVKLDEKAKLNIEITKNYINGYRMNIVTVIPARGGSKSIPKKNITLLDGVPLIKYSIDYSIKSKLVNKTIVSTDSKEIAKISKSLGAEVPFMRPENLAED